MAKVVHLKDNNWLQCILYYIGTLVLLFDKTSLVQTSNYLYLLL